MPTILVVGLSALGAELVRSLASRCRIFAVDRVPERVAAVSRLSGVECAEFDASDPYSLASFLPDGPIETGIVAIGGDFLMAERVAETLRGFGRSEKGGERRIRRIIVTANRGYRAEIIKALGHDVVTPVLHAARSLAECVARQGLASFHWMADPSDSAGSPYGVGEIDVPGEGLELPVDDLEDRFPGVRVLAMRDRSGGPVVALTRHAPSGARLVLAAEARSMVQVAEHLRALAEAHARSAE